mgnify:CR=1 FL=1
MARSNQSFNKKEKEKKKKKKRDEKLERQRQRRAEKAEAPKKSFEDMISYIDEDGNVTSTPPDPLKKKKVIKAEDIVLGVPKREDIPEEKVKTGKVKFFNHEKGYGFINDAYGDSMFVHINNCIDEIFENSKVTYEVEMGPKGPTAVNVQIKE